MRQVGRRGRRLGSRRTVWLLASLMVVAVTAGCSRAPGAAGVDPHAPAPSRPVAATEAVAPAAATSTAAPATSRPRATPTPTPAPTLTPTPAPEPAPVGPPVTLAFGGDVMFEGMIRPQLDADPEGLLDPVAAVLGAADVAVVNLETAITTGGSPEPKQYTFRAPEAGLAALIAAGVDVASLANNHGMDYGIVGLQDTLAAADRSGLPLVGAGRNADEAYAPFVTTVRNRDIAIIGATQVMDSAFLDSWPATDDRAGLASAKNEHEARLVEAVTEARAVADTVVVYLHWGVEAQQCPAERQQTLARRLVDAGADVIVGGHAHRLQGAGLLDGALVAYGLGNFVFYAREGPGADSGVLTVTVEGRDILDYTWTPARIRDGIPHPLEGQTAAEAVAAWEDLRSCTGLARGHSG